MKKIFVAMLALAAATACSNDELVSVNQEAIGFDNAFINNSVRSVDPSYTNDKLFSDFAVFGFVTEENTGTLFDGTQVSGSVLNGEWTYTGTQYWIEGATYNFYAVAPYSGAWTKTAASVDGVTLTFDNANGTQDLLFAKAQNIEGQESGQNETVEFTFGHILSKVKFSFTNGYDATNSSIRVENIKINNAYTTGSVVLGANDPAWTVQDTNATLELVFGNAATTAVDAEEAFAKGTTVESYNERLLIPVSGPEYTLKGETVKGYNVTFDVKVLVNGVVVKTYSHSVNANFTPEAGHSYDIAATITAENINPDEELDPIEFTVTGIDGWDETDANKTI